MQRVNVKYHGNSTNLMNFEESLLIQLKICEVTPSMSLLNLSASKRTSISAWKHEDFPYSKHYREVHQLFICNGTELSICPIYSFHC